MKCCICGPVKNCGPYLNKVLQNIEKIGSIFENYKILIFYDDSTDDTLQILKKYQSINPKLSFFVNKKIISPFRTHNIAFARNYCLNYIKKNKNEYEYFIMMDFDDVNCKECNPEVLQKYLSRNDWDALSFNSTPKYYDIWGLSIWPFCFSYNHFNKNDYFYKIIQNYVTSLLNKLPKDKLLPCISSFNGFSIYKTFKFLNTYYDGRIQKSLIATPIKHLQSHSKATKSKLVFKKYITSNCKYEDCEHRLFHILAIKRSKAKIRISPDVLFY